MSESTEKLTRIAIVDGDKCKPKKCIQECKRSCPVVRMGKLCIEVTSNDKISVISEDLCIGCGICCKKCFDPSTKLVMYDGSFRKASEIKPSDRLMGDDSTPRRVKAVISGSEEMFKIKPLNGKEFIVTGDHILVLKTSRPTIMHNEDSFSVRFIDGVDEKSIKFPTESAARKFSASCRNLIEITVNELLNTSAWFRQHVHLYNNSIDFPNSSDLMTLPIHPFLLGIWLSNAKQYRNNAMIEFPTVESLSHILSSSHISASDLSSSLRQQTPITMANYLQEMNLLRSPTIPFNYRTSTQKARAELLAGFIEASASRLSNNMLIVDCYDRTLLDDILSLALSLGLSASSVEKQSCIELHLSGKRLRHLPIQNNEIKGFTMKANGNNRRKFDVESVGLGNFVGFTTDGNQRILLSDFTVTHNCPFEAIQIINLPSSLQKDTTHRYGPNSFKLHRLPVPRQGSVLGLVGTNGIGKSTALQVLSGKLKPNLGSFTSPPDWKDILAHFRGSELQNFFTKLLEDNIKAILKPQYVDSIPRSVKGRVDEMLARKDDRKVGETLIEVLDLQTIIDREIGALSGGELQRFAIAITCAQLADVYMFDEPSSYLDVRQRLRAAQAIRSLCADEKYVICVEHDLSVLDYLSDYVCCLYGKPGAYGVVTAPFSVREGINIFLAGFVPTENLRFRKTEMNFKVAENVQNKEDEGTRHTTVDYPSMTKQLGNFKLTVKEGGFTDSEIIVMLGENGTGKTTFIKMLAGLLAADDGSKVPTLNVSYKPQIIAPKFEGTVGQLLHSKIRAAYTHQQFQADVMKPLLIEELADHEVKNLSGGELQRVALTLALGKPADIYLIDEPSAYLDSEQRIHASKVIKRFILHARKTAFIVEHDFIMATYLADRVIVYEGKPAHDCTANSPQPLVSGMNAFLKSLAITFRRDPSNHRPRINKFNSLKDKEQKSAGTYFYLDADDVEEELSSTGAASKDNKNKSEKKKKEKPAKK